MQRLFEGRVLVAYWLLGTASFALLHLALAMPDLFANPAGWRAVAGPCVVIPLAFLAAIRLLRTSRGFRLAALVLTLQLFALSAGPLAYRLDVGPAYHLALSADGLHARFSSDARLLLIVGATNRVPAGAAINLLALGGLLVLFASWPARLSPPAGNERCR